jgi:hypothetical protein
MTHTTGLAAHLPTYVFPLFLPQSRLSPLLPVCSHALLRPADDQTLPQRHGGEHADELVDYELTMECDAGEGAGWDGGQD